jgi:hypothetical protein
MLVGQRSNHQTSILIIDSFQLEANEFDLDCWADSDVRHCSLGLDHNLISVARVVAIFVFIYSYLFCFNFTVLLIIIS